jgi:hypothetical protein
VTQRDLNREETQVLAKYLLGIYASEPWNWIAPEDVPNLQAESFSRLADETRKVGFQLAMKAQRIAAKNGIDLVALTAELD